MTNRRKMHKILLYIYLIVIIIATGCSHIEEIDDVLPGNDNVVLNISIKDDILTRAETSLAFETAVTHLDLFFASDDGTIRKYQRMEINSAPSTPIVVPGLKVSELKGNDWTVNTLYTVANSGIAENVFKEINNADGLKAKVDTTQYVYITGTDFKSAESDTYIAPQTFLMTGMNNNITITEGKDLQITIELIRAVAKVTVNFILKSGAEANFHSFGKPVPADNNTSIDDYNNIALNGNYNYSYDLASYYVRNLPYITKLWGEPDENNNLAKRKTNPITNAGYLSHSNDNKTISVTLYVYTCTWGGTGDTDFTDAPFLIVNLPAVEILTEDGGGNPATGTFLERNYYEIPLQKRSSNETITLQRNYHYILNATINAPGGLTAMEPVPLVPVFMEVYPWNEKQLDVGGDENHAHYLNLSTYSVDMHNVTSLTNAIKFASSTPISTITLKEAYFIDKFGLKQDVTSSVNSGTSCSFTGNSLNGYISINSTIPENNAIRTLVFTVRNTHNIEQTFTVEQYPLIYITNQIGWYSYRTDVMNNGKITHYENKQSSTGENTTQTTDGKFVFRVSRNFNANTGKSDIYTYNASGWLGTTDERGWKLNQILGGSTTWSLNNARMYHIVVSATSTKYTLGIPQMETVSMTDNTGNSNPIQRTVRSSTNKVMVSPSFLIASQLGTLESYSDSTKVNLQKAEIHCANYVETYTDATTGNTVHLKGWRLPTEAELMIIQKHQTASDAMDELLLGRHYFCASETGVVEDVYPETSFLWGILNNSGYWTRCVRDAYDSDVPNN